MRRAETCEVCEAPGRRLYVVATLHGPVERAGTGRTACPRHEMVVVGKGLIPAVDRGASPEGDDQ